MTREEAVLRLEVLKDFSQNNELKNMHEAIDMAIRSLLTADVVEVVHCKNCVHYQPSLFGEKKMCFRKDVDGVQICYDFSPDDYCSYGERREDARNGNP